MSVTTWEAYPGRYGLGEQGAWMSRDSARGQVSAGGTIRIHGNGLVLLFWLGTSDIEYTGETGSKGSEGYLPRRSMAVFFTGRGLLEDQGIYLKLSKKWALVPWGM